MRWLVPLSLQPMPTRGALATCSERCLLSCWLTCFARRFHWHCRRSGRRPYAAGRRGRSLGVARGQQRRNWPQARVTTSGQVQPPQLLVRAAVARPSVALLCPALVKPGQAPASRLRLAAVRLVLTIVLARQYPRRVPALRAASLPPVRKPELAAARLGASAGAPEAAARSGIRPRPTLLRRRR
jgi:hypothetical protein